MEQNGEINGIYSKIQITIIRINTELFQTLQYITNTIFLMFLTSLLFISHMYYVIIGYPC